MDLWQQVWQQEQETHRMDNLFSIQRSLRFFSTEKIKDVLDFRYGDSERTLPF